MDMGRYFFNSHHDFETQDPVGRELKSLDAACGQARLDARNAAASEVKDLGTLSLSHRIEIKDETGETIGTVRLADAVRVRR
jgi:hypothetical protein